MAIQTNNTTNTYHYKHIALQTHNIKTYSITNMTLTFSIIDIWHD